MRLTLERRGPPPSGWDLPSSRLARGLVLAYLGVLVTYLVVLALPGRSVGVVARDVVLGNLVYAVPCVALVLRGWAGGRDRLWILLLGAAFGAWTVGNLLYVVGTPPLGTAEAPLWAGVGYLTFYPLVVLAVACSAGLRRGRLRRSVLLDGLAVGLAAAALSVLVGLPLLASLDDGHLRLVATVGPLVGDVTALAMIAGIGAVTGGRSGSHHHVLALGLAVFVTADAAYAVRVGTDSYVVGTPFDAMWALGVAVMAASAWRAPRAAGSAQGVELSSLWIVAASSLTMVGVLAASSRVDLSWIAVALAAASLLAAATRVVLAFGQVHDLAAVRLQALTDELTGLPNRRHFARRMTELLDAAERDATIGRRAGDDAGVHRHGLLLIDLDGFKEVNDSLGHAQGDLLLQEVALRLGDAVGPDDLVARLGGDEFAVVLKDAGEPGHLDRLTERLLSEITRPVRLDRSRTAVSGSIGVVPFNRGTCELLLGNADLAMYDAKGRGRNQAVTFTADLRRAAEARLSLDHDLRDALANGRLELWYQPVVDLRDGSWVGAEGLCRWRHPTRGRVAPDDFIALAEEIGLIAQVGEVTRALALPQIAAWKQMVGPEHEFGVGLNISGRELDDPGLVDRVLRACGEVAITADAIVLEVTESSLMGRGRAAHERLAELRGAGMKIAIDDFGTGYSSLAYLAELPADILKLDRSFVASLCGDRRTESVVRAAFTLAHDLDMVVLAEGIETEEQRERLLGLGCVLGQGFHLQRPVPPAEFTAGFSASLGRARSRPGRAPLRA